MAEMLHSAYLSRFFIPTFTLFIYLVYITLLCDILYIYIILLCIYIYYIYTQNMVQVRYLCYLKLCWLFCDREQLPALYPLFFKNLEDSIASVRQGAAIALVNVVKAYGELFRGFLYICVYVSKQEKNLSGTFIFND